MNHRQIAKYITTLREWEAYQADRPVKGWRWEGSEAIISHDIDYQ